MRGYSKTSTRSESVPNYNTSSNNVVKKNRSGRKKKRNNLFSAFFSDEPLDTYLFFLVVALTSIGLVMILSSSYYSAIEKFGTGYHYFKRQFMWAALGLIALLGVSKVNYNIVKRLSTIAYIGSIILLVAVFIIGVATKGATRWIEIGSFISFQPSEIAKIALIAFLAMALAKRKDISEYALPKGSSMLSKIANSIGVYAKEIGIILIPTCLIIVENWSTAIVVCLTGAIMMSISGFKLERWIIAGIILFLIPFIFFIKAGGIDNLKGFADGKYDKRLQRFETWLDPFSDPTDSGFQTVQSLYAIGSGGITGVGLGKSKQKLGYLQESHNDMIFTIICEEFGLIGALVVLGLFMALIIKCSQIALHAPDKFSMYFVVGMMSLIALQVIINVGVVTGVIPNTGMPLPFISYGGTSLLFTMIGMGIVLNISRYSNKK